MPRCASPRSVQATPLARPTSFRCRKPARPSEAEREMCDDLRIGPTMQRACLPAARLRAALSFAARLVRYVAEMAHRRGRSGGPMTAMSMPGTAAIARQTGSSALSVSIWR